MMSIYNSSPYEESNADMTEDPRLASWPPMPLAVIVGAGAMGMAIASRLGQRHRLILAEVDAQRLEAAAATLKSEGIWVVAVACDVTQATSVNALAPVVSDH